MIKWRIKSFIILTVGHNVLKIVQLSMESNNIIVIIIIYRPGARGIRRNISRSDDIFRGALPRVKYHH
jgi:hypothetical protein